MSNTQKRIEYIDALRGIAILAAMLQHISLWMIMGLKPDMLQNPIFWTINGVAGMSGPLFVALSGYSTALMLERTPNCNTVLVKRGLLLIIYGYIMNILAPHWFIPTSWFVLHMLGFGMLSTPIFRHCKTGVLIFICATTLAITALLHDYFNVPLQLTDRGQEKLELAGNILRSALFEGRFSILPWIAVTLTGVITYRLIRQEKIKQLLSIGAASITLSVIFGFSYFSQWHFLPESLTRAYLGFLPLTPTFFLFCVPLFIFVMLIGKEVNARFTITEKNPLVSLGRASLTLYVFHIVVIRGLTSANVLPRFTPDTIGLPVTAILVLFTIFAVIWRKYNYKYGLEWLLRKV